MATKTDSPKTKRITHSILAYSHGAITAFRYFTKEDFLHMMFDMTLEDIKKDAELFKELEEYEICSKLKFVIREKEKVEALEVSGLVV